MTRPQLSNRWLVALGIVFAAALVVCAIATARADPFAPVFVSFLPEGTDIVVTKEQYDSAVTAQVVGRISAVVAFVAAAALVMTAVRRRSRLAA
jgi:heme A synthase